MKFLKLSQSDDLFTVIRKCNENFRQLAWGSQQATKAQSQIDAASVAQALQEINGELDDMRNQEIPDAVSNAIDQALNVTITNTLSDFFTEDNCTVTACNAMKWGNMAFIRFSYRLNSTLTVPSNGDITDVTLGKLKIGWRPFDMTNVILDQTRIIIGDVNSNGDVIARSANSRGTSYTIDANAVLYASMMLMLGIQ